MAKQQAGRRSTRWARYAALVGAVSLLALSAHAALLNGSDFEADDGNQFVNQAGNTDWESVTVAVGHDLASGSGDDSFGQGSKEDTPIPSPVTGSVPPNKSDLLRFYVASDTGTILGVEQVYMYLGWVRTNILGTANIDFEFNQSEVLSSNGVTPVRTAGDVLITFDFASGANKVELSLLFWITTGSSAQCEQNNSLPCWGNRVDLDASGVALGAVNNVTIADLVHDPGGTTLLDPLTFGEAAINLTAAGVIAAGDCNPFASAYVKSRSSDSFTSALKDYIAPIKLNLNTCGRVDITKKDDLDNPLAGAVFTLFTDSTKNTVVDSCTTNAMGQCSMTDLAFGTYWLSETTVPAGHAGVADQSVTISAATPTVTLNLVNPRLFKVITIVCKDGVAELVASSVELDGTTKTTLVAAPAGLTSAQLCALGGAVFGNLEAGVYQQEITIP